MERPTSLTTTVTMVYAPNVQRALDGPTNLLYHLPLSQAPLKAQKLLGSPVCRDIPVVRREDSSGFLIVDELTQKELRLEDGFVRDDPSSFFMDDVSPKALRLLGEKPPKHSKNKTKSPSLERLQSFVAERPPPNASPKALRLLGDDYGQRLRPKAASEEPFLSVSPRPSPNASPKALRVLGASVESVNLPVNRFVSDSNHASLPQTLPRTKSKSAEPSSPETSAIPRSVSEEPSRKASLSSPNPMSRSESMFKSSTSLATLASDFAMVSADWFSSLKRSNRRKKLDRRANGSKKYASSVWELSTLEVVEDRRPQWLQKGQLKDELQEVCADMENIDTPDESKNNNKRKQMSIGRKKFNMDPKKGIEFLQTHELLQATPEDVAGYLYKGEGLNKTAIGDYLGEKNPFNEKVLRAFVDLHDFTDLILVQALRQFLWSFRLPGEAQKIDRMMECFAQRYCQLNPAIFTNTDTCYVLSFAIIMLNTSLHNPSVKDKPSVEQFINMNRGINNGGDLPRELLVSFFESIKTEPFKIPEDDGNDLMHTFFNPDKEGWLWKQGGRYKSWKRRWFILNDNCLYYFEYTTDKEPRGIIPLENISVRECSDRHKPHCFELFATGTDIIKACKTDSEGKVVEGKHTVYRMSAASQDEKEDWMKRLGSSISTNPFYDMLAVRKKKAQKTAGHGSHAT